MLTPEQVRNLVSALIGYPGLHARTLPMVRPHFDAGLMDQLAAAMLNECVRADPTVNEFATCAALDIALEAGGPHTAAALRRFLANHQSAWTLAAITALLTIEGVPAIAAAVAASREFDSYQRKEVEQAIDQLCAKANITPLERELRSLGADPASRKAAVETLKRLYEGGFAYTANTYRETIAANPLLQELAATLVWGELTPTGHVSRTFLLNPGATPRFPIVIVHPAQVTAEEAQSWRSTTRPVFPQFDTLTADGSAIHLPSTSVSPSALLTGLEARGWTRTRLESNTLRQHAKAFPLLHCTAYLRYTGIPIHYGGTWTAQQAVAVHFDPPQNASPIAISQINADLAAVFGG